MCLKCILEKKMYIFFLHSNILICIEICQLYINELYYYLFINFFKE